MIILKDDRVVNGDDKETQLEALAGAIERLADESGLQTNVSAKQIGQSAMITTKINMEKSSIEGETEEIQYTFDVGKNGDAP